MQQARMTDEEFDTTLIGAAFASIARDGWHRLSITGAMREAGLDLARARRRIPSRATLLLRFGTLADATALAGERSTSGTPQEHLFDLLMRRLDVLQAHRAGVLALLRALPTDPAHALLLATANLNSMRWLLEASGLPAHGLDGSLRANGLLAVWLWTLRTWRRDDSADLSATMATLDAALARAAQIARSLPDAALEPSPPPLNPGPLGDLELPPQPSPDIMEPSQG
jgi:ubiquinone biosynthesis protein COQ9